MNEEMAELLRAAGWRVAPPLTIENCPHTYAYGSGSIGHDGSGHSDWFCPACGKHSSQTFPASVRTLIT
jgi:hypothetical protein